MLLAIHMPEWLVDFWTVYGDMITPLLTTLLTSVVTYMALKIKTDAKVNAAKTDMEIQALKEVSQRENYKGEIEILTEQIEDLEKTVKGLCEMVDLAFQNSDLDPEIKSNLSSLINKVKYGTEDNLIKELEDANTRLQEQINELSEELAQKETAAVDKEDTKVKRTRR